MFTLITIAAAILGATAQSTTLDIQAIQANFQNALIVPNLLPSFDPSALIALDFSTVGQISPGQNLTQDQVKPTPSITLVPANSSVTLPKNFTLTMVDAGPVGTDESQGQTRHWLVNGVSLTGSASNQSVSTTGATPITDYAGPAPPAGSGPHRYVILLFEQPASFTPPANLSQPNTPVSVFDLNAYAKDSGLGPIVAGMYLTVQNGDTTASLSPTSAVITSTLPAAHSTGSSSASGTKSGSPSPSTTASAASPLVVMNTVFTFTVFGLALFILL
ncbi:PEBP-like protein [Rickenella mellea]|uniref:PEBP-like protein n=1 Tax=Rickenella mellea TaxID=50990 RepID=A0A4Y7QK31_9AGAM|nr:PEBP-like protein [Rickenella mellea]